MDYVALIRVISYFQSVHDFLGRLILMLWLNSAHCPVELLATCCTIDILLGLLLAFCRHFISFDRAFLRGVIKRVSIFITSRSSRLLEHFRKLIWLFLMDPKLRFNYILACFCSLNSLSMFLFLLQEKRLRLHCLWLPVNFVFCSKRFSMASMVIACLIAKLATLGRTLYQLLHSYHLAQKPSLWDSLSMFTHSYFKQTLLVVL